MKDELVECRLLADPREGDRECASSLVLPPDHCAVIPGADAVLRLVPESSPAATGALLLELVRQREQPLRLLAVADDAGSLRVNGQAAPRVAVLRENDVVQWGPEVSFVVEFVRHSVVGPPPPELVGRPCPICRVPFSAAALTYGCVCGTRLHCEAREDRLQCAQRSRICPSCRKPVVLEANGAALPA